MELGKCLQVSGFLIRTRASRNEIKQTLQDITFLVGMDTAGICPKVWRFPHHRTIFLKAIAFFARFLFRVTIPGLGGTGFTIVQPLVESFVIADYWDDHGHWFVVLGSCKPYNPRTVLDFLIDRFDDAMYREGFVL